MSDAPKSPAAIAKSAKTAPASSSTSSGLGSLQPFYKEIAGLPAKVRLDRILSRKDTMRVVRGMPVPDLLTTINDVGAVDCLELLELMSPAQVQGVFDLDGWRKDRLDPTSVGRWLRAFFAASPDRTAGQLRGLDLELLTLLLKVHCTIFDLSLEEEPTVEGSRQLITPDGRYLIVFGGVSTDDETLIVLQQSLDRLMARDMGFVLKMCEAVRWEIASQLEEDAFRWRNARLADLGFLPQHEAAPIFAWIDPDAPFGKAGPTTATPAPMTEEAATSTDLTTSPLLPWSQLSGNDVLGRALSRLGDDVRDRVAHELMLTANRVHAADGQDIGDTDALKETARTTAATAGTGLSYLVKGDESKLSSSLASTSVMVLFRIGHSLSLKLATDLRARLKGRGTGLDGRGLLRLDAPLREVVAGFLRPRPLLFGGLLDPRRVDYRPVSSLNELTAAAAALSEASFRAALLEKLGANEALFAGVDDADLPSHGAILGALLVGGALAPLIEIPPLTPAPDEALLAALDEKVRGFAPLPGAVTPNDAVARTRAYVGQVWSAMIAELSQVRDRNPDARFVSSLWTR